MTHTGPHGVSPFEFHRILQVTEESTPEEIKKSFRRLALQFHPDKNLGDREAEEMFKAVSTAFQVLREDNSRVNYEAECRRWMKFGPPQTHHYRQPSAPTIPLHPITEVLFHTLPAILFSKTRTGVGITCFTRLLSAIALVSYDITYAPWYYSMMGIYPSIILLPAFSIATAMIVSPLFCKNWKEFLSYLQGAAWMSLPFESGTLVLAFATQFYVSQQYANSCAPRELVHVMNHLISHTQHLMISAAKSTTSLLIASAQSAVGASKQFLIDSLAATLSVITNSPSYAYNVDSSPRFIENINEWTLVGQDEAQDSPIVHFPAIEPTSLALDDWVMVGDV